MPKHNPNATIHSVDELMRVNRNVEVLIVDSNVCNDECCTVLNLSHYANLKVFEVGDSSCNSVNEVRITELNQLERVIIGDNCFKGTSDYNPNGHFHLKNCERLRELRIGFYSFSNYVVCEIENVDRLEVIEMGELSEMSLGFHSASLELKSKVDVKQLRIDLPSLKSLLFGDCTFSGCSRAAFESE